MHPDVIFGDGGSLAKSTLLVTGWFQQWFVLVQSLATHPYGEKTFPRLTTHAGIGQGEHATY